MAYANVVQVHAASKIAKLDQLDVEMPYASITDGISTFLIF